MTVVDELSYSVWALAKQRNKTKSKRKHQQKTNKDLYLKSNVSNAALARNDNSVANLYSADEDKNVNKFAYLKPKNSSFAHFVRAFFVFCTFRNQRRMKRLLLHWVMW